MRPRGLTLGTLALQRAVETRQGLLTLRSPGQCVFVLLSSKKMMLGLQFHPANSDLVFPGIFTPQRAGMIA